MDWSFSEEQEQLAALVREICERELTEERMREVGRLPDRFDRRLYDTLTAAGVLTGLGIVELCRVFVELGRTVAPVPVQPAVASMLDGDGLVTPAVDDEPGGEVTRAEPEADRWLLTGAKTTVPAGTVADAFLVTAETDTGTALFRVERDAPGVSVDVQTVTSTDKEGLLTLERAAASRKVGDEGTVTRLLRHLTVAVCAHQLGVCERALELTAEYSKQRVQFDRPIATFQAVGQRLADAFIDVEAMRLTLWQAAWRLSEAMPCDTEIATAKFWAADAGHRVAHTAVHVHGGVGIDLDHPLHRYFVAAKRNEFALGGATEQLTRVGLALAEEPA